MTFLNTIRYYNDGPIRHRRGALHSFLLLIPAIWPPGIQWLIGLGNQEVNPYTRIRIPLTIIVLCSSRVALSPINIIKFHNKETYREDSIPYHLGLLSHHNNTKEQH